MSSVLDSVFIGPRVKIINYRTNLPLCSRKENTKLCVNNIPSESDDYQYTQWILERIDSDKVIIRNVKSWLPVYYLPNPEVLGCKVAEEDLKPISWQLIIADKYKYGKGYFEFYSEFGNGLHCKQDNDIVCYQSVHESNQWKIQLDDSVSLKSIRYLEPTEKKVGEQSAKVLILNNNSDTVLSLQLRDELTLSVTETRSFSWDFGLKYTHSITASGGVPGFLDLETNMSLEGEFKMGEEYSTENNKTKTQEFTLPLTVPPKKQYVVKVFMTKSTSTVPFIATMQARGVTWEEKGTYRGVDYGEFHVDVQDTGDAASGVKTPET